MNVWILFWAVGSLWYGQAVYRARCANPAPIRNGFIDSLLVNTLVVVILTEALSVFHQLNDNRVGLVWTGVAISFTGWAIIQHHSGKKLVGLHLTHLTRFERRCLVVTSVILALTLLTAFLYPPNNYDSLTYHMGRIGHWMQQQGVQPFATHIEREIYQPPLAEWVILHTLLLSGSDLWANTVQWLAGVGCLVALSLLTKQIGGSRSLQIATVLVAATIPMFILQSSSTQNDLVVAFYLILVGFFLLRYYQNRHIASIVWAGLALGFALLSKGTAYLFSAPLLLTWGIMELRRHLFISKPGISTYRSLHKLALSVLLLIGMSLGLNAGHYARNLSIYGHPLTNAQLEGDYKNRVHSVPMMVSNISRNLAIHFGVPIVNKLVQHSVESLHTAMEMDIQDANTTFGGSVFKLPRVSNNEDNASCFVHLLWLTGSLIGLIRQKNQQNRTTYVILAGVLAIMFMLFCAYLKWQPWHTRLHLVLFLLASPIGAVGLIRAMDRNRQWPFWLFVISAGGFALTNPFRPLITLPPLTQPVSFLNGREKNYFVNGREHLNTFVRTSSALNQRWHDSLRVGLLLDENDLDYLWYHLIKKPVRLYHIRVTTPSKAVDSHPLVDYVISMHTWNDTLHYNGEVYKRLRDKRGTVALYSCYQKSTRVTNVNTPGHANVKPSQAFTNSKPYPIANTRSGQ